MIWDLRRNQFCRFWWKAGRNWHGSTMAIHGQLHVVWRSLGAFTTWWAAGAFQSMSWASAVNDSADEFCRMEVEQYGTHQVKMVQILGRPHFWSIQEPAMATMQASAPILMCRIIWTSRNTWSFEIRLASHLRAYVPKCMEFHGMSKLVSRQESASKTPSSIINQTFMHFTQFRVRCGQNTNIKFPDSLLKRVIALVDRLDIVYRGNTMAIPSLYPPCRKLFEETKDFQWVCLKLRISPKTWAFFGNVTTR